MEWLAVLGCGLIMIAAVHEWCARRRQAAWHARYMKACADQNAMMRREFLNKAGSEHAPSKRE